jgi:hypothetical protein
MPIEINNRMVRTNLELIQGLLKLRNKRGKMVPFNLNLAQQYYWARKTRRNLIVKARQKGISKIIDGDQLIDCIRKPTNAVVISHEKEATKRLFSSVRSFIDNLSVKPEMSIDSKSEIRFPKSGSSYFIGTAGQKAFGRGDTVQRAHLSEAAFYDNLERILTGISEAAEYGQIDIETTPNGRDQVYDMWQKAKGGMSSYTPIFIPWFIDNEYSTDEMTEEEKGGLSKSVQEMFLIPEKEFEVSYDEKKLNERVKKEWGIELTIAQLKWRRYKIWDKALMFYQEYPEDDVSCFLQSGRTVFANITTDITKRIPLDNLERWGATKEQKEALRKRRMFAGVDGAEGTPTGDRHSFAVVDVEKGKGYVVYEYTSNDPIDIFWNRIKGIMSKFDITLGIEKNGVGVAHVQKAKQLKIKYKEWETTAASRPLMITELEEAYRKEDLIESYPEAENEARDMEYSEKNRAEHKAGKHDDRIFARAIAWQIRKSPRASVEWI